MCKRLLVALLLVVVLSLPGIADLFLPGYYSSHDGTGHVIRLEEFYRALQDGHFPVRWSGNLYYGYGYPFFNFNYPSVYYAAVPLVKAGLSAADAMKAETILAFIASGVLMFLYLRRRVAVPWALLGTVVYLYAPYRLASIYVRGSVAEAAAFVFPPLLFWAAENLAVGGRRSIPLTALIIGLLGVSHNISALLLLALFGAYLLFLAFINRSPRPLWRGALAAALGISLAAFFVAPALAEKRWTFLDLTLARDYPDHFVAFFQLFLPGWGYGASVAGPGDGMSFSLGAIPLTLFFLAVFVWLKNRSREVLFWLAAALVAVFLMLSPSRFIWDRLPLLPFVQFPWRLTIVALPAMVIAGCLALSWQAERQARKKRWVVAGVLVFLMLASAGYKWHRNQTEWIGKVPAEAIAGSTTWAHEQATRWLTPRPDRIPAEKIQGREGPLVYAVGIWKTGVHEYRVNSLTDNRVVENTMYYPGWRVWVDGREAAVNYQDKAFPGRLVFPVSAGEHQVVSRFQETLLRLGADLVSAGGLALLLGLFLRDAVFQIFSQHQPRLRLQAGQGVKKQPRHGEKQPLQVS